MSELKGACIFGQSGGPTSVINASAYGVIATALKNPNITWVLGAEHGIKGVLNDRLFDMGLRTPPSWSCCSTLLPLLWVPAALKWRTPMWMTRITSAF